MTARLYRPSAILCWSKHARNFCKANPDIIRVVEDDGTLLLGRVEGFGGDAIRGRARVEAQPGRLLVRDMVTDLDGTVVLRYHFVPCLTSRSSVACEPELEEPDPVPFIRLRPPPGIRDVELRMTLPGSEVIARGGRYAADSGAGDQANRAAASVAAFREGVNRVRDRHRTHRAPASGPHVAAGLLVALVRHRADRGGILLRQGQRAGRAHSCGGVRRCCSSGRG